MSNETPRQPRLGDLFARYLAGQAEAQELGAATLEAEVLPYEAGPVQAIDARLAWDEALVPLAWYAPAEKPRAALPHWPALVAGHEPVVALPCAAGNFPQLVRSFQLLTSKDTAFPEPGQPLDVPLLQEAAERLVQTPAFPDAILVLGGLRLARHFEAAQRCAQALAAAVPPVWRAGWENERAALCWQAGERAEARQRWQALAPSVPVLFNRGLAELFVGVPAAAVAPLQQAAEGLAENSAWRHLAQLYVTLARMRAAG